jgi:hypothetical protein
MTRSQALGLGIPTLQALLDVIKLNVFCSCHTKQSLVSVTRAREPVDTVIKVKQHEAKNRKFSLILARQKRHE